MYLAIDVGGTKTLVATFDNKGELINRVRFPTPTDYDKFISELAKTVDKFTTTKFKACGIAIPGKIDRKHGVGIGFGRLSWASVPIKKDLSKIVNCPIEIDNDANLAGLSEATLVRQQYNRVLYVTISTGIGTGIIVDQQIDPDFMDSEGGEIMLEHRGKLQKWEDFASGQAITKQFGKKARDIHEEASWHIIASNLAEGLIDLIAVIQPEVIILGGGVSNYFSRFSKLLRSDLKHFENVLVPIPPIKQAQRPEYAVLYGCYELAKQRHG